MKNIALVVLTTFLSLGLLKAETKNVDSKIKHVTVYPSGATINREAITNISNGTSTLRFYGISPSINPNSIQIEAKGDYIVQSISYKYDYLSPFSEPKIVRKLRDSIVVLNDKRTVLSNESYVYNQEIAFILGNKTIGNQQIISQSEEFQKMAGIIRTRLLELKKMLFDITLKERELNKSINRINAKITEIRGSSPKPQGIIEIQLMAEENISGAFKLSYLVNNAAWRPVYDLKFEDIDQPIAAKYNAYVQQSTGVAWNDVKLTLSTSSPQQNNTKPVMHPWYLYFKNPVDYRVKNTMILDSYSYEERKEEDKVDSIDLLEKSKSSADFTASIESVLALDFEVNLPYQIPSDGKERIINLKKIDIPASYTYYTAPKLEQEAFLVANMTEWANLQLLPGAANIFMGNTYMGASYLNPGIGSDTIQMAFGRDKMVQVSRQLLSRECKKSKLAGKQRHNLVYEITVRNLHKSEIELVIEDQIPVSNLEEIEIELTAKDGADLVEKTGILTWEEKVQSGGVTKRKFSFEVKHPRNKVVYPLNYM